MFCPKCGAQMPDGTKFCMACGTLLNQEAAPQAQPQEAVINQTPPQSQPEGPSYEQPQMEFYSPIPQGKPKKSPLVPILIIAIAAALIAAGVLLFFVLKGSGASDVPGNYKAVAVEYHGHFVDIKGMSSLDGLTFSLKEGGEGTATNNGKTEPVTWEMNGSALDIKGTNGESLAQYVAGQGGSIEFKDGRIIIHVIESGITASTILAKDTDDLSDLEILSMSEFMQKYGAEIFGQSSDISDAQQNLDSADNGDSDDPRNDFAEDTDGQDSTDESGNDSAFDGDEEYVHPELKDAVDAYADFIEEYILITQKYKEDPSGTYDAYMEAMETNSSMTSNISEIQQKLIEKNEFTTGDKAYITDVYTPILTKLGDALAELTK